MPTINILTHNNTRGLTDLISSIEENTDSTPRLCIIDDSESKRRSRKNRTAVEQYSGEHHYLGSEEWDSLAEQLTAHVDSVALRELLVNTRLGVDRWNTPAARRVSHLASSVLFDDSSYLFLDDDMRFESNTPLTRLFDVRDHLVGLQLAGSFDLSYMEWVALFNRYVLHESDGDDARPSSFETTIYGSDYVTRLARSLSQETIRNSIAQYTNLLDSAETDADIRFPGRTELNGGAYLCSRDCVELGYHPPWCGEDWSWFEYVINQKFTPSIMDITLVHDSDEKNILSPSGISRSVFGSFITYASRLYARNETLTLDELRAAKENRIAQLRRELDVTRLDEYGQIADCNPGDVRNGIEVAVQELQSISIPEIRWNVEHFYQRHRQWEQLLQTIRPSDVGPVPLQNSSY